jgi:lysophospholipase L1-like esterase
VSAGIGGLLRGYAIAGGQTPADAMPAARVPAEAMGRFPLDTASAASIPAGVRLEFAGDATAVRVAVETTDAHPLASPGDGGAFSVWCGDVLHARVEMGGSGRATVELPLPERRPDERVQVFLPEARLPRLLSVEPVGGAIEPLPPAGPRWLAYGDSITQGWTTSDPGLTWTAVAARAAGLDVCNLGFAGAARGELAVASFLAQTPADVISLAWGTNCWAQLPAAGRYLGELMRAFLAAVRQGHPQTPIVVLSPLVRPEAETTANSAGADLRELRAALEQSVRDVRHETGDRGLHLVEGLPIIGAGDLVDGIHPGDEGHAMLARVMADALGAALGETPGPLPEGR